MIAVVIDQPQINHIISLQIYADKLLNGYSKITQS